MITCATNPPLGGLHLLKDPLSCLRNEQLLSGPAGSWRLSLDSASVRTWARLGPLCQALPFTEGSGAAWSQPRFFGVTSVSWPPRPLGLDQDSFAGLAPLYLAWVCLCSSSPLPGPGSCRPPLTSWVTAPVACVETLRPSHLPSPSIHVGIVSSHCHTANGITEAEAELTQVYTDWILRPSCPKLGP